MPNKISSNLNIIIIFFMFFFLSLLLLNHFVLAANWSGNCAVKCWLSFSKRKTRVCSYHVRVETQVVHESLSSLVPVASSDRIELNWSDWKNWNTFKRFISFVARCASFIKMCFCVYLAGFEFEGSECWTIEWLLLLHFIHLYCTDVSSFCMWFSLPIENKAHGLDFNAYLQMTSWERRLFTRDHPTTRPNKQSESGVEKMLWPIQSFECTPFPCAVKA